MAASRTTSIGRLLGVLVAGAALLALAAGCSSDRPSLPGQSTTTTATSGASTSTSRETTTTTAARTTTTTEPRTTTTTGDGPTTTTSSTVAPTTTTSTTKPSTTTTTRPATTTTKPKDTTTTTAAGTTTTATGIASDTIGSGESDVPWLAIAALAALLVLVLVIALRRRSERNTWWARADALVHDGRALVDVGSAGPAGADPQQVIAHWGTIEQRAQAFANQIQALSASGVPDDVVRGTLGGLTQATADYLAALRTARTLRIGPPAPTPEQLQFADAEAAQRLAIVRATLDQFDQLVLPHRKTP